MSATTVDDAALAAAVALLREWQGQAVEHVLHQARGDFAFTSAAAGQMRRLAHSWRSIPPARRAKALAELEARNG